jgi:hypothetical protein
MYEYFLLQIILLFIWSRDSVFGIATGYQQDDIGAGVRVPEGSRIFSTSSRPAVGPTSLLSNGYKGAVSPGVKRQGVKLNTHLQLVPRSRKCGSIHPLPIRLHGVVLNYLSIGTTLPFLPLISVVAFPSLLQF